MRYNFFLSISLSFFLFGCTASVEIPKYSTKTYEGIQKDQVLHATKKVFRAFHNKDFLIDSYRNDVNITRTKVNYYVLSAAIEQDNFHVNAIENNGTTTAILNISRSHGLEENEEIQFIYSDETIHKLLWDRIEYFLGLKENWPYCITYNIFASSYDFLCDPLTLSTKSVNDLAKIDLNATRIPELEPLESITLRSDKEATKEEIKQMYNELSPDAFKETEEVISEEEKAIEEKAIEEDIKKLNDMLTNGNIDEVFTKELFLDIDAIDNNVSNKEKLE